MTARELRLALASLPNDAQDLDVVITTPSGEWNVASCRQAEDLDGEPIIAIIPRED